MKTAADLWADYRPDLEDAKLLDRKENSLVFLIQPVKVGRYWLAPLTLRRLLYLEAFDSPFVGREKELTRQDILRLLWILHPKFVPSIVRGKLFALNNYFINWKWYAMEAAQMMAEGMALMAQADQETSAEAGWVATYVDGFCSQYHWRLDDVLDTPLLVSAALGGAIGQRVSMGVGGGKKPVFTRNADRVRKEFLAKVNKLNAAVLKGKEKADG